MSVGKSGSSNPGKSSSNAGGANKAGGNSQKASKAENTAKAPASDNKAEPSPPAEHKTLDQVTESLELKQESKTTSPQESNVDSLLGGMADWASPDSKTVDTSSKAKADAVEPPSPDSPEYGEALKDKVSESNPELAEKLDGGKLSAEDIEELTDLVSQSPELGGLEGFARSTVATENGYSHGYESPQAIETLGEVFGRNTVPVADAPNEVSQEVLEELGLLDYDLISDGYQEGLSQQDTVRPGMAKALGQIGQSLPHGLDTPGAKYSPEMRAKDGSYEIGDYSFLGFRGDASELTVETQTDRGHFNNEAIKPGVDVVEGGAWVDLGANRGGMVQLNGAEMKEAARRGLEGTATRPDPVNKEFTDKMLSLIGGTGGVEGAQAVAELYQSAGVPVPGYLN